MDRPELLTKLCEALPELREVADLHGLTAGLEKALEAARNGESIEEPLRGIGLLSIISPRTTRGIWDGPAQKMASVPGSGSGGHVSSGAFRCPKGVCGRTEQPAPDDDRPSCGVFRSPLRFESD